jgi:hypothetical protein
MKTIKTTNMQNSENTTAMKNHSYRPSEILKMKELLRTGERVSKLAPAHYKEFGVSFESFKSKLYQIAKVTRIKGKRSTIDKNVPKTVVELTLPEQENNKIVRKFKGKKLPKNIEFFEDRMIIHF